MLCGNYLIYFNNIVGILRHNYMVMYWCVQDIPTCFTYYCICDFFYYDKQHVWRNLKKIYIYILVYGQTHNY